MTRTDPVQGTLVNLNIEFNLSFIQNHLYTGPKNKNIVYHSWIVTNRREEFEITFIVEAYDKSSSPHLRTST